MKIRLLRAMLAALALALAFPPYNFWPLVFVSLGLFLGPWVYGKLQFQFPRARDFVLYNFVYLFSIYVLGFFWLSFTLNEFGNLPWVVSVPLTGIIFAAHSVFLSFLAWIFYWIIDRKFHHQETLQKSYIQKSLLVFCVLMIWEFFDLRLFPWTPVHGFGVDKYLLASVGTLQTVGWQVLVYGAIIGSLHFWSRGPFRGPVGLVVCPTLCIGIVLGVGGFLGAQKLKEYEKLFPDFQEVALIQGNIGNYEKKLAKSGLAPTVRNVLSEHVLLLEKIENHWMSDPPKTEPWVFWPETSYPLFPVQRPQDLQFLMEWSQRLGAPQWVGTYHSRKSQFGGRDDVELDYNVVAMVHPKTGLVGHYEKSIRVIFGEYIPGDEWWPEVYEKFPAAVHFGKADKPVALPHPNPEGPVFLPLICYEILYPKYVKDFVAQAKLQYPGRELVLVNATNDSWYGSGTEPFQHSLLGRWTVASLGLPTVRPTNTGLSQVIAPWGEVLNQGAQDEPLVVFGRLPVRKAQKPY